MTYKMECVKCGNKFNINDGDLNRCPECMNEQGNVLLKNEVKKVKQDKKKGK